MPLRYVLALEPNHAQAAEAGDLEAALYGRDRERRRRMVAEGINERALDFHSGFGVHAPA
jgi:hypothetical protein